MFRKRKRNSEDEADDCVPISKRINGLCIENNGTDSSVSLGENGDSQIPQPNQHSNNGLNGQTNGEEVHYNRPSTSRSTSVPSGACSLPALNRSNSMTACYPVHQEGNGVASGSNHVIHNHPNTELEEEEDMSYEPELSQAENPHYFSANELLFNAHLERTHRRHYKYPK